MKNKLEEKNKEFFKKIASKYDKGIHGFFVKKRNRKIIELTNIKNNSKILDLGCGTGEFLEMMSNKKSLHLYGLDLSKEMLKFARRKLKNKAKLKFGSTKYMDKYYNKDYFDYIFISDAFHHFAEQEKVIKKAKTLLKKKGKLIIADLNFGKFGNSIFHIIEPGNSGMPTLKEYRKLFEENDFHRITQKKIGIFSFYMIGVK